MDNKRVQDQDLTPGEYLIVVTRLLLLLGMIASVLYCLCLFGAPFSLSLRQVVWAVPPLFDPMLLSMRALLNQNGAVDLSPLVLAGAIIIVRFGLDAALALLATGLRRGKRAPVLPKAAAPKPAPPKPRIKARKQQKPVVTPPSREAVLKRLAQAPSSRGRDGSLLESARPQAAQTRKQLAFLSLEAMSGEGAAEQNGLVVEHALLSFREWANGILDRHGAWKSSWGAGSALIAFRDPDAAAAAAREILADLHCFNAEYHRMSTPLQVRLALVQGEVEFVDHQRLEDYQDPLVDLVGDLRRGAPPDSLLIIRDGFGALRNQDGFRDRESPVEGREVLGWTL